ncbi:uncharacterized protein [Halyomorpha halys]|uniref:uncharacterized protein isoform X2 n=1 Tax=Halyomorpha halys TaxID=286706 RepID=UPI0006D50D2C|nr:uncharacterized protein LOC106677225 isoform X2 [Halyomorpha halys]
MGDLKCNTYGYLNLAWSICSLLVCTLYNPYQSCKYCRNGKPPGNVMLPFSFGVALLSQHVISLSLAKFPFLPCLVVQIFLGLAVQNYSTFIWIQADEYVLKELSKICRTEEEILLYWWYIMVMAGIVVSLVSFAISTCSRGHIYFKNGLQIKPWTCYWNRLTNKKVNFLNSVAIIPHMYKG